MDLPDIPFSLVLGSGITTLVLASALAYVMMMRRSLSAVTQVEEEPKLTEIDDEKYPGGHLTLYFASQTGTAESFANTIQREGEEHGFFVHVIDLEDITVDDLLDEARRDRDTEVSRAAFMIATYGEGEPTDNSVAFVGSLRARAAINGTVAEEEKKESDASASSPVVEPCLNGLEYCVFGLGNRQYEHYNNMSKFFDSTLDRLGGKRVLKIGLGDDDNDLEGDFETWKENVFWPGMKEKYLKDTKVPVNHRKSDELPTSPYQVEYLEKKRNLKPNTSLREEEIHSSSRYYFTSFDCPLRLTKELRTKEDPGSTLHLEIDISKAKGLSYQTSDNFGVLPVNDPVIVEFVAKALGYDLDAVFVVKSSPNQEWHGAPFPMPLTVRECLTRYCDLTGSPRRSDLKRLAAYAKDPTDKKALLRMSSKEGKAEYKEKVTDAYVGLVDILRLCPSIEAPPEHFLDFCPRLVPRYYTISSSSSVHPKTVHLTVSVTEVTKKDGTLFRGVCSRHLADLTPKQKVRVFHRDSAFRLPQDLSRPIIMIGPGTGVAPMRGFLQERAFQKQKRKQNVGKNILYFGCKKRTMDFLYEKEFNDFQASGVLDELHLAFSREQKDKVYVQHLLAKNAKDTWALMNEEGAYVYVCGGTRMGQDVKEALRDICMQQGALSKDDANDYLDRLASEHRFVQELWA